MHSSDNLDGHVARTAATTVTTSSSSEAELRRQNNDLRLQLMPRQINELRIALNASKESKRLSDKEHDEDLLIVQLEIQNLTKDRNSLRFVAETLGKKNIQKNQVINKLRIALDASNLASKESKILSDKKHAEDLLIVQLELLKRQKEIQNITKELNFLRFVVTKNNQKKEEETSQENMSMCGNQLQKLNISPLEEKEIFDSKKRLRSPMAGTPRGGEGAKNLRSSFSSSSTSTSPVVPATSSVSSSSSSASQSTLCRGDGVTILDSSDTELEGVTGQIVTRRPFTYSNDPNKEWHKVVVLDGEFLDEVTNVYRRPGDICTLPVTYLRKLNTVISYADKKSGKCDKCNSEQKCLQRKDKNMDVSALVNACSEASGMKTIKITKFLCSSCQRSIKQGEISERIRYQNSSTCKKPLKAASVKATRKSVRKSSKKATHEVAKTPSKKESGSIYGLPNGWSVQSTPRNRLRETGTLQVDRRIFAPSGERFRSIAAAKRFVQSNTDSSSITSSASEDEMNAMLATITSSATPPTSASNISTGVTPAQQLDYTETLDERVDHLSFTLAQMSGSDEEGESDWL